MNKLIPVLFSWLAVPAFAAPCIQGLELEIENQKVVVSQIFAQDQDYSGEASVSVNGIMQDTRWNQYSKDGNLSLTLPNGDTATIYFDGTQSSVSQVTIQESVAASDDIGPAATQASYRVQKVGSCPALTGTVPCFKGLQFATDSAKLEIQSLEKNDISYAGNLRAVVNGQAKNGRWYYQDWGPKRSAGMRIEMSDSAVYVIEFAPRTQEILKTYQEISSPSTDPDVSVDVLRVDEKFQIEKKGQCSQ